MKIQRIVFLQGDQARKALKIYERHGAEGALQYLDRWFTMGAPYEPESELSAGTSDKVYEISDYVLTVNTALGYIGLEYIWER